MGDLEENQREEGLVEGASGQPEQPDLDITKIPPITPDVFLPTKNTTRSGVDAVVDGKRLEQKKLEHQWLEQLDFSMVNWPRSPEEIDGAVERIQRIYDQNLIPTEVLEAYRNDEPNEIKEWVGRGAFLHEFKSGGVEQQLRYDLENEPNYFLFELSDPSQGGKTIMFFTLYAPINSGGNWGTQFTEGKTYSNFAEKVSEHITKMHPESEDTEKYLAKRARQKVMIDTIGVDRDAVGKGVGTLGSLRVAEWLEGRLPPLMNGTEDDYDVCSFRFRRIIPYGKEAKTSKERSSIDMTENMTSSGLFKGFKFFGTHRTEAPMTRTDADGNQLEWDIVWHNEYTTLQYWKGINAERMEKRREHFGSQVS